MTPEEITLRYVSLMGILTFLGYWLLRLLVMIGLSRLLLLLLLLLHVVLLVMEDDGRAIQLRQIILETLILIIWPCRCRLRWLLLWLRLLDLL